MDCPEDAFLNSDSVDSDDGFSGARLFLSGGRLALSGRALLPDFLFKSCSKLLFSLIFTCWMPGGSLRRLLLAFEPDQFENFLRSLPCSFPALGGDGKS